MKKEKIGLTFGFELEGVFSDKLGDSFDSRTLLHGEFKFDGSVSIPDSRDFTPYAGNGNGEEETCRNCDGDGYISNREDCDCSYICDKEDGDIEKYETFSGVVDGEMVYIEKEREHEHDSECLPCYEDNIHEETCNECDGRGYIYNGLEDYYTEFASGVYEDRGSFLQDLARFRNDINYNVNESCGYHLHVGLLNDNLQKLQAVLCNMDFGRDLEKLIAKMCKCQVSRWKDGNNNWCRKWRDSANCIQEFKNSSKYWAVNFHRSGTVEFRFLKPCEHKLNNTKMLLRFLDNYLNKKTEVKITKKVEPSAKENKHYSKKINNKIEVSKKINFWDRLGKDISYNITSGRIKINLQKMFRRQKIFKSFYSGNEFYKILIEDFDHLPFYVRCNLSVHNCVDGFVVFKLDN